MNIQAHCTQCNKSLYQLPDSGVTEPTPEGTVTLFTQEPDTFDRIRAKQVFCDWACVINWARSEYAKSEYAKASSLPSD